MLFAPDSIKKTTERDRRLAHKIWCLLQKASQKIEKLPSKIRKTIDYRCHSICRAIHMELGDDVVRLVDGWVLGLEFVFVEGEKHAKICKCRHSWLMSNDGSIIDPYPVGFFSLGPIVLVHSGKYKEFSSGHYLEDENVKDELANRAIWRESVIIRRLFSDSHFPRPPRKN